MKKILLILAGFYAMTLSFSALSHAEHDKPRFVASSGIDQGRCDSPQSPCKTIRYAARHANKGDNIRVATGSYQINDVDTLFYLLSETLPIKGNYHQKDQFKIANKKNITRLIGVPLEYAEQLTEKGFTVIVDQKGQNIEQHIDLNNKLDVYARMQKAQTETVCEAGMAGDFACSNIDLLAHIPLSDFSSNPAEANDIWGHYDLNNGKEYALLGLRNGVGIIDVSDPINPEVVTTIPSQSTIWRDLKVYQFFDHSESIWKSYAYVTADNASVGMMIIDLNSLPDSAAVVSIMTTDLSAHNVYLSNVDYSTGVTLPGTSAYLHIAGSDRNGGAFNSYGLSNPEQLTPVYTPNDATRSDYSHDVSSMVITDERKDTQCVNGTEHCEIFFDFNENNFQLWDKTDNTNPSRLSTTSYPNASYVHSGWYTEDKLVVIVHDELDEQNAGLNTTVRFFDMSDLTSPQSISTWTGSTAAIDHNGFVRGNRYYMSNYERGLTVLDITDPSSPVEAGFFDTYPFNNSASFNGAWGVYPFLPSGNILVSDINSGLYILKDNTTTSVNGSFRFGQNNYNVNEGENVDVLVERVDGSQGEVQVGWELTTGAADETDFVIASGVLTWANGDSTVKTINVATLDDINGEGAEAFFVRLLDPKSGATLISPNLATITIAASVGDNPPDVFAGEDFDAEIETQVSLEGVISDLDGEELSFSWEQIAGQVVVLSDLQSLTPSFTASEVGDYQFMLSAVDPRGNSADDTITVTILPSNSLPQVNAGDDSRGNTGVVVNLVGTATDPDGDSLTYHWTQIEGRQVTLSSIDSLETSFKPLFAGTFGFQLEVTDSRGGIASDSIEVIVETAPFEIEAPEEESRSSGGGSINFMMLILVMCGFLRFRNSGAPYNRVL